MKSLHSLSPKDSHLYEKVSFCDESLSPKDCHINEKVSFCEESSNPEDCHLNEKVHSVMNPKDGHLNVKAARSVVELWNDLAKRRFGGLSRSFHYFWLNSNHEGRSVDGRGMDGRGEDLSTGP